MSREQDDENGNVLKKHAPGVNADATSLSPSAARTDVISPSRQFEFIHLSDGAHITYAGAQRVRSHAMRDFRRRQGLPTMLEGQGMSQGSKRETKRAAKAPLEVHRPRDDLNKEGERGIATEDSTQGPLHPSRETLGVFQEPEGFSPKSIGETDKLPFRKRQVLSPKKYRKNKELATTVDSILPAGETQQPLGRKKTRLQGRSLSVIPNHDGLDQSEYPLGLEARNRKRSSDAMVLSLAAGLIEPFNVLPATSTRRVHILIDHYLQVHLRPTSSRFPHKKWVNEAFLHPDLFRVTILHCATSYASLYGLPHYAECSHLAGDIMRAVNAKLSDPEKATTDASIAEVACLVCYENTLGNVPASKIHLDGLQRMVELRGGLGAFPGKDILLRLILWADQWHAMLALSKPRFPIIQVTENLFPMGCFSAASPSVEPTRADDDLGSCLVFPNLSNHQRDINRFFQGLQVVSHEVDSASTLDTTPKDTKFVHQKISIIEYRLLLFLIANDLPHIPAFDRFILRSSIFAAFIYIYSALREPLLESPFFNTLVQRLRAAVDHRGFLPAWSHINPTMLLWVLAVGATAAKGRLDRPWFVARLATGVFAILEIHALDQLRGALKRIMWIGSALDAGLPALWLELESKRREANIVEWNQG